MSSIQGMNPLATLKASLRDAAAKKSGDGSQNRWNTERAL